MQDCRTTRWLPRATWQHESSTDNRSALSRAGRLGALLSAVVLLQVALPVRQALAGGTWYDDGRRRMIPEGEVERQSVVGDDRVTVQLTRVDDESRAFLNEAFLVETRYGRGPNASQFRGPGSSDLVDITDRLRPGENRISFYVWNNDGCCDSGGFMTVRQGDRTLCNLGVERKDRTGGVRYSGTCIVEVPRREIEALPGSGSTGPASSGTAGPLPVTLVTASSQFPASGTASFEAGNAADGSTDTVWLPRRTSEASRGEWIEFQFGTQATLHELVITNGDTRDSASWTNTARVRELQVSLADGREMRVVLADTRAPQRIPLVGALKGAETQSIKLTIRSIYFGARWLPEAGFGEVAFIGTSEDSARRAFAKEWPKLEPWKSWPRDVLDFENVTGAREALVSEQLTSKWLLPAFQVNYEATCPSLMAEHQLHFPDLGFYFRVDQNKEMKFKAGGDRTVQRLGRAWSCGPDAEPNRVELQFDGNWFVAIINGTKIGPLKARTGSPARRIGAWRVGVSRGAELHGLVVKPLGVDPRTAYDGDAVFTSNKPVFEVRLVDAPGSRDTQGPVAEIKGLSIGTHLAVVTGRGQERAQFSFDVLPGARSEFRVRLDAVKQAEPAEAKQTAPVVASREPRRDVSAADLPRPTLMLAADPARPERLYRVDDQHGLWWTNDGGAHWTEAVSLGESPSLVGVRAGTDGALLGIAEDGLFYSADVGQSWRRAEGLEGASTTDLSGGAQALHLAMDPRDPATFFVAAAGALQVTRDGGGSFEEVEVPAPLLALATDGVDGSLLFGMFEGEGLMLGKGQGWVALLPEATDARGMQILRTAETPDEVLLALADGTVMVSEDAGTTFHTYGEGFTLEAAESLLLLARDPVDLALMLITDQGRLFRRAAGSAWEPVGRVEHAAALATDGISFLSLAENQLRVGSTGGVQSFDLASVMEPARAHGGATRVMVRGQDLPAGVVALAADPANPERLIALGGQGTLWTSEDGGRSFSPGPCPKGALSLELADDGTFITSGEGLFRLAGEAWIPLELPGEASVLGAGTDEAGMWVLKADGLVRVVDGSMHSYPVPDAVKTLAVGGAPWVADAVGEVFRWTGGAWEPTGSPSSGAGMLGLVADSTKPGTAFVATEAGVFRLDAGGQGWRPIATDLFTEGVRPVALAMDPSDHSLYLALSDGRLMRSVFGGGTWRSLDERMPGAVIGLTANGGALYLVAADGAFYRLSRVLSRQRLSSRVFFKTGSATLSSDRRDSLAELTAQIDRRNSEVRVEGHTDDVGAADVNERLSADRAQAVADVLVSLGFPLDRITLVGVGPRQPIADNATEDGRAQNRRVEILLVQ